MTFYYGLTSSDDVRDVAPGTIVCAGLYSPEDYRVLDPGCWISLISPLNGIAMLRIGGVTSSAYKFIKRPHLHDQPPTAPMHSGFWCELLYDNEHYSEFVRIVTESSVARDYLGALVSWPGLSDTKLMDARELMRVALAKDEAMKVLRELGM